MYTGKFIYTLLFILFLIQTEKLAAQYSCNDTTLIMNKKGSWRKSNDVIHDREISAAAKTDVYKRINQLFEFVKEAYPQPIGCEPKWYHTIESRKNKSPVPGGPQPYSFNSLYLKYSCDKRAKDLFVEDATGTWLWIFVNQYSWLLKDSYKIEIDGKPVQTFQMPARAGEINGLPYYWISSFNPNAKTILFTRKDENLFTSITRRQYLEWYIKDKEKRNKEGEEQIMKTKIRPAAEQEAEKNRQLQKIIDQNAKQTEKKKEAAINYFLKTYQTDEERRDERLQRYRENTAKELKKYYDELNNSDETTLNKPAWFGGTKGIFSDEEKKGNWTLVVINESYFRKTLPPNEPQLIIFQWNYTENHISDRFLNEELMNKFPFNKLQELIK